MKSIEAETLKIITKSLPEIDGWQASIAALELGRHLQTVERQIRPKLFAQIRNAGLRLAAIEETAAAGALILLMCESWSGTIEFPNMWNPRTRREIEGITGGGTSGG